MSSFLWSIGMIGNDSSATAHHQISENIIVNASERKTCLCGLGCCIDQQKKITTQQTQLFQPKFPPREEAFQKNTAVCPSGSLIQLQNSLFFLFDESQRGQMKLGIHLTQRRALWNTALLEHRIRGCLPAKAFFMPCFSRRALVKRNSAACHFACVCKWTQCTLICSLKRNIYIRTRQKLVFLSDTKINTAARGSDIFYLIKISRSVSEKCALISTQLFVKPRLTDALLQLFLMMSIIPSAHTRFNGQPFNAFDIVCTKLPFITARHMSTDREHYQRVCECSDGWTTLLGPNIKRSKQLTILCRFVRAIKITACTPAMNGQIAVVRASASFLLFWRFIPNFKTTPTRFSIQHKKRLQKIQILNTPCYRFLFHKLKMVWLFFHINSPQHQILICHWHTLKTVWESPSLRWWRCGQLVKIHFTQVTHTKGQRM